MDILQTANERMEQLAALMNKDIKQKVSADRESESWRRFRYFLHRVCCSR